MKTPFTALAFAVLMASLPATAYAAASCKDEYYRCLNDTWNTRALERILADAACLSLYYLCLRSSVA
jgi:hypothetical protein